MGKAYIIEHHHMRDRIIADLMGGRSSRYIAEYTNPPITASTINNYKMFRLKPLVAQMATESAPVAVPHTRRIADAIAEGPIPAPSLASAVGHKTVSVREDRLRQGVESPIDPSTLAVVKQALHTTTTQPPAPSIFRQRLEKLHTRVERVMDRAEETDALGLMAPLIGQAHKNAELLGRATGELEMSGNTSLTIQILSPSAPSPALAPRISYASIDAIDQASYDEEEIGIVQRPQQ